MGLIIGTIVGVACIIWALSRFSGDENASDSSYQINRGDFLVSVVAGGTLEAVNQEVIRNEVDGTSRVIYIIPEGNVVKEGDLLVELDSAEAEEQVNQQKLSFEKSTQEFEAAKANLQIEQSQMQSMIDAAVLATNFAYIDYRKFQEGDKLQQMRNAEIQIQTVEENLKIAQDRLFWSQKLFKEGFETRTKLEQDQLSVTNFFLNLEQSKTEMTMLKNYDLPKLEETYLSSLVEQSNELRRVILQATNTLNKAVADLNSQSNSLALNEERLVKETEQLDKSKIYAPKGGMVVYAKSRSRFSSESMIEEGATVRKRQDLITLPDTSKMKVEIKVHESQINKVKKGQTAFVVLDSAPDKKYKGIVSRVAPLPDSASFFSDPNLKEYATEILVTDPLPAELKPGVSARTEIVVTNILNTLKVPIQSVTTVDGKQVVYKAGFGEPEVVVVEVGLFNTKFIQVLSGIEEGNQVLLSPPLKMEEINLAGEVFDDSAKLSKEELTPDAKALEQIQRSNSKRVMEAGGNANRGGSGRPGNMGQGGGMPNMADIIKRFDKDGDGKLSDAEKASIRSQFQGGQGGQGGKRPGQ